MEPLQSIEEAHEGEEVVQFSTDPEEAPLPVPFEDMEVEKEAESRAESHMSTDTDKAPLSAPFEDTKVEEKDESRAGSDMSTDTDEAPLPALVRGALARVKKNAESRAGSDMTPLTRPGVKPIHPYIDRFGLQQPPPPSNLYGGDNVNNLTGRREYLEDEVALLPFHHEPETWNPSSRRIVSTAGFDVYNEAEAMQKNLLDRAEREGVDVAADLYVLEGIKHFTHETCNVNDKSSLRGRSMEDQMEDILRKYSFDKMKLRTRKVDGAQAAEPYVSGENVDCQRSAGTLTRKRKGSDGPVP
ncbi:MAG: hypothetical protein Q9221_007163 [Calogaya cf. arnoldii]